MNSGKNAVSATPRQLESIIRLSEARARLRFSDIVEKDDVAVYETDLAATAEITLIAKVAHLVLVVEQKGHRVQVKIRLVGTEHFAEEAFFLAADFPAETDGDHRQVIDVLVEVDRLAFGEINSHCVDY